MVKVTLKYPLIRLDSKTLVRGDMTLSDREVLGSNPVVTSDFFYPIQCGELWGDFLFFLAKLEASYAMQI